MSLVKVQGNASGTGIFTIASPNGNTDRTLTLPDATGTMLVSGQPVTATTGNFSGDVTLGSSVLATPTGSAPSYTCRAWVNFNGTGTVAIRGSGNVSSVTDGGTGSYTVNFTTALPDLNFSVVSMSYINQVGSAYTTTSGRANTTSSALLAVVQAGTSTTLADSADVNVAIFR
jgi:hypothetical protein